MEIKNTEVFALRDSVRRSGIPMSTNIDDIKFDPKRAENLAKNPPGTGHNCFLKGIEIQADIKATIKFWAQWERYHFNDIISSQSTMHKIKDMELDESYIKYVDDRVINIMKELQEQYNENPTKENFYKLVYTNPDGLQLTVGITSNYLQEKTVYLQRRNHKLKPEWGVYCDWLESLPHSEFITENGNKEQELLSAINKVLNNNKYGTRESINHSFKELEKVYNKYID